MYSEDSDGNGDEIFTPPAIFIKTEYVDKQVVPEKSRSKYESAYNAFREWQHQHQCQDMSEDVLLTYFEQHAKHWKPSTLWARYSMIKPMLNLYHQVDISVYKKLSTFLKNKSHGYESKKAKVFTPEEIQKFLIEAPDMVYLAAKVITIFGITGACRGGEFSDVLCSHVQLKDDVYSVEILKTRNDVPRSFTITNGMKRIVEKYASLRPSNVSTDRFFLNYQKGRCTSQPIGINKFRKTAQTVAEWLKLEHPELYTGHSFRRTSATVTVDNTDITTLKRHTNWKSTSVVEGDIKNSITNQNLNRISTLFVQKITEEELEKSEIKPGNLDGASCCRPAIPCYWAIEGNRHDCSVQTDNEDETEIKPDLTSTAHLSAIISSNLILRRRIKKLERALRIERRKNKTNSPDDSVFGTKMRICKLCNCAVGAAVKDRNGVEVKPFAQSLASTSSSSFMPRSSAAQIEEMSNNPEETTNKQLIPGNSTEGSVATTAQILEASYEDLEYCQKYSQISTSNNSKNRQKRTYMNSRDFATPEKNSKNLNMIKRKMQNQTKKIRCSQQTVRKLKNRLASMKMLVDRLKEKSYSSEARNSETALFDNNFPEMNHGEFVHTNNFEELMDIKQERKDVEETLFTDANISVKNEDFTNELAYIKEELPSDGSEGGYNDNNFDLY